MRWADTSSLAVDPPGGVSVPGLKEVLDVVEAVGDGGRGEGAEDGGAVAAAAEAAVEDGDDAAVAGGADEAAEALLEQQGGAGQGEFGEPVGALAAQVLGAGGHDGVVGHGERQAGDDDEAEGVAADIDAFPEGTQTEEDAVVGLAEALQEVGWGGVALAEAGIGKGLAGAAPGVVHGAAAGEEEEGAAAGGIDQLDDAVGEAGEVGLVVVPRRWGAVGGRRGRR